MKASVPTPLREQGPTPTGAITPEKSHAAGRDSFAPAPGAFEETRLGWLALALVWLVSALYLAFYLRCGWTPFDSGMLAETAARTLRGQVPFRDFGDLYTGGLTYLNALAFRLFGVNLFSLRIPLFLFFLGWVPAVYWIARRIAAPLAAGAVTLLAVVWSVPVYPEAMPSWYNLFFATWGVLALLRYIETERRRWLWLAGFCGGLSFLAKISGLYFVAAVLLFLVFRGKTLSPGRSSRPAHKGLAYRLFVTGGLVLFLALLVGLIYERPTGNEFFQFALPSACLVAFLLWENWRLPRGASAARFGHLFGEVLPFLAGAAVPVALFLLWFASRGALGAWFVGVFIRPAVRTHWSAYDAISVVAVLGLLPAALIVVSALDESRWVRRLSLWGAPIALSALLLAAWRWIGFYELIGYSLPLLVPVLALVTPFCLRQSAGLTERQRQQVFLLVAAAVLCDLIAYPFSNAVYLNYVAPLPILAVAALLALRKQPVRVALASLLAFYLVFAVWLRPPGYYLGIRVPPRQAFHLEKIPLRRAGGILTPAPNASKYASLIPLVREHARGAYMYATPDIPDFYFLSGLRNPTATISDLLDPDFFNPVARDMRILATLESHNVNVVVIGPGDRTLAGKIQPGLRAQLDARYPKSIKVADFEVRWKP